MQATYTCNFFMSVATKYACIVCAVNDVDEPVNCTVMPAFQRVTDNNCTSVNSIQVNACR